MSLLAGKLEQHKQCSPATQENTLKAINLLAQNAMLDKFALRHLMLHLLAMKASNPKMMPLKQLDNLLVCLAIKMSTLMKPQKYVQR